MISEGSKFELLLSVHHFDNTILESDSHDSGIGSQAEGCEIVVESGYLFDYLRFVGVVNV